MHNLRDTKTDMLGIAKTASASILRYGAEVATSCDPLAAAIAIGGKVGVGLSLSRFSASQCAGLVGVIVSSITPQVMLIYISYLYSNLHQASVPLLLKKISEDLDYLKKSMDIVRENPQFMANDFLSIALENLNSYKFKEVRPIFFYYYLNHLYSKALKNFKSAEYEATKGIHMAPTFQGVLGCVQIPIFSSVMLECASTLEGIPCFIPIHCLQTNARNNVEKIIENGLSTIMKRAQSKRWNGRHTISVKTQNLLDPLLASLYNPYSLSANLTDPYADCSLPPPESLRFTINVSYIPEGENDNCKLEVLLHDKLEFVLFIWKAFQKYGTYVFLRHKKTTWTLNATNGNLFSMEYDIQADRLATNSGELEKTVGWPTERMSIKQMIEEAKLKMDSKIKHLSHDTYKWIKRVPMQYLNGMQIDIEESSTDGLTLLHILAKLNETKNMKCLLDKISNIDPCDSSGWTPLHIACATSSFKAARMLIEYGANVNALTNQKDSPLTILASQKEQDLTLLKMLLNQNAKREQENKDHMRAVDLVRQSNSKKEVVKLLRPR